MLIKPKREVRITRLRRVQQKEEALGAKGTGPAGLRVIRDKIAGTRGRIQKRLIHRTKRKRSAALSLPPAQSSRLNSSQ